MHHALDVFLRTAQPILQRQKVGAQVLGGAGDESQHLRDAAQHFHLFDPCRSFFAVVFGVATHFFQKCHGATGRLGHIELANAGKLYHFAGRHGTHDGVAMFSPGLQVGQNRQEMVFHEQHRHNDDVALGDILTALRQMLWIGCKL